MRATVLTTLLMAILSGGACHTGSGAGGAAVRELQPGAHTASGTTGCAIPARLQWRSTGPLVTAVPDAGHAIVSIKDPTVVYFNDQWHVYATTADVAGHWSMVYLHFGDWSQAGSARPYYMSDNPVFAGDYHAAPELFYFTPQNKWYLVYQSGPPTYSMTDDPSKPNTWSPPTTFFAEEPSVVTSNQGAGGWLDFWVICDATDCYLFFSDDNGNWYRSQTTVQDFPAGFGKTAIVMHDPIGHNLFEASHVYKLSGTSEYLALIEAIGPTGHRFFRSWIADTLVGSWASLADTWAEPFVGLNNVSFAPGASAWTRDISHGEMIRDGYDETLTVDPCHLRFVYQGVDPAKTNVGYSQLPYQLGLLSRVK